MCIFPFKPRDFSLLPFLLFKGLTGLAVFGLPAVPHVMRGSDKGMITIRADPEN